MCHSEQTEQSPTATIDRHADVVASMRRDPTQVHDEAHPEGSASSAAEARLTEDLGRAPDETDVRIDAVVRGNFDPGEYNPDNDPAFGDRNPANRSPERLTQRRLDFLGHLSDIQGMLADLAAPIAAGTVDSAEVERGLLQLRTKILGAINSAQFEAGQLVKDMLKTDQERHDAALRRFDNSPAFQDFNGRSPSIRSA